MYRLFQISILGFLFPLSAGATTLEWQQVVIRDCNRALEEEPSQATKDYFISRITSWEEVLIKPEDAVACLRAMSQSDDWNYDPRTATFVQGGDLEEYQRQAELRASELLNLISNTNSFLAANAEFEWRKAEAFVEQTKQECIDWYEDDRRAALTNLVCNQVFAEIGVPLNPPEGLNTQLVEEASIQLQATQIELEELMETGLLRDPLPTYQDFLNKNDPK